jgi:hypothetical protein
VDYVGWVKGEMDGGLYLSVEREADGDWDVDFAGSLIADDMAFKVFGIEGSEDDPCGVIVTEDELTFVVAGEEWSIPL